MAASGPHEPPRCSGAPGAPLPPGGPPAGDQRGTAHWIGLLSGTSADAVDAALIEIGPRPEDLRLVAAIALPMPENLRRQIDRVGEGAVPVRELVRLDVDLGHRLADAAECVARSAGLPLEAVEGIASHGQTVGHFPESSVRGSLQLGSPDVLHARTGRPVVHNFRAADLAAGGEGAPLTPYLHLTCLSSASERRAVLNLGGFTNVTYLPDGDPAHVVAFDPGPGNALLDRAARWASKGSEHYDVDGGRSARGRAVKPALDVLLADPYFALTPPKSTGHEHFGPAFFERARREVERAGGGPDDLFATLAELTVQSVCLAAQRFFPGAVDRWIVYGGGLHNVGLMERLEAALAPARVESSDAHGLPHESLEAVAFAQLGWCSMHGQPGNLPTATGARQPVVLGSLTPPSRAG